MRALPASSNFTCKLLYKRQNGKVCFCNKLASEIFDVNIIYESAHLSPVFSEIMKKNEERESNLVIFMNVISFS